MFVLDTETAQAVVAAYRDSNGSLEVATRVLRTAYRGLHEAAARQIAAAILGLTDPPEAGAARPPSGGSGRHSATDR